MTLIDDAREAAELELEEEKAEELRQSQLREKLKKEKIRQKNELALQWENYRQELLIWLINSSHINQTIEYLENQHLLSKEYGGIYKGHFSHYIPGNLFAHREKIGSHSVRLMYEAEEVLDYGIVNFGISFHIVEPSTQSGIYICIGFNVEYGKKRIIDGLFKSHQEDDMSKIVNYEPVIKVGDQTIKTEQFEEIVKQWLVSVFKNNQ